jgi:GTP-binding protein
MYDYLRYYDLDGIVVATKSDKLSAKELRKNLAMKKKELQLSDKDVLIPASALKRNGVEELLNAMEEVLNWQE